MDGLRGIKQAVRPSGFPTCPLRVSRLEKQLPSSGVETPSPERWLPNAVAPPFTREEWK
ncbi:hypothetical protein PQG02_11955 [Nostoc sp. UHCC 0926]|uniref:hypothetical protein n=1 Tax=Nostoc sp. TaxID=1180 RepID=UPI0027A2AEDE|nr:hypothetical protein PQG02_11955 [Nostoc sp. UHCC 0926]